MPWHFESIQNGWVSTYERQVEAWAVAPLPSQPSLAQVPYWLIPDGLASDPFFVEKVHPVPSSRFVLEHTRICFVSQSFSLVTLLVR